MLYKNILSSFISWYFTWMQTDWATQVDWGRSVGEEEKWQLHISVCPSEGKSPSLTPFLGSEALFLLSCLYLSRKISNRGQLRKALQSYGDSKPPGHLPMNGETQHERWQLGSQSSSCPIWQGTEKDLPSQIPSFLVEAHEDPLLQAFFTESRNDLGWKGPLEIM